MNHGFRFRGLQGLTWYRLNTTLQGPVASNRKRDKKGKELYFHKMTNLLAGSFGRHESREIWWVSFGLTYQSREKEGPTYPCHITPRVKGENVSARFLGTIDRNMRAIPTSPAQYSRGLILALYVSSWAGNTLSCHRFLEPIQATLWGLVLGCAARPSEGAWMYISVNVRSTNKCAKPGLAQVNR